MEAGGLKECPRCMSDCGYNIWRTDKTSMHLTWDGAIISEKKTYNQGMAYCRSCGVIILNELEYLKGG